MITESKFQTDDIAFAEAFFEEEYGSNSRVPVKNDPYTLMFQSWSSGAVTVGNAKCTVNEVIRAHVPSSTVLIHLPADNASEYRLGRPSLTAMPNRAVILPASHEYTLRSRAGLKFALAVNTDLLLAELENQWTGRRGHTLIKAGEIRLTMPDRRRLSALYQRFQHLGNAESGQNYDRSLLALNAELASWCTARILENSGCQPLSPKNQMRVDQLSDWIERHLAEPICLDRLAEISGIGIRGLNKICKAARGMASAPSTMRSRPTRARPIPRMPPGASMRSGMGNAGPMEVASSRAAPGHRV